MRGGGAEEEEFDDFESRVSEVEQTIKALMEGKIDPAECDKKEEELKRKMKEKEEQKIKKKEQQERQLRKMKRDHERKKWGFVGRWCPRCRKDECQIFEQVYGKDDTKWPEPGTGPDHCISNDCKDLDEKVKLLDQEERRSQLQDRVEQMKKERLAKALARDRWNRWKSTQNFNRVGAEWEEKYNTWDKWLPSDDEEDELPPAPPPDTPEFKIMEKDMDDRAKDKAKRRREAEAFKKKGNAFLEEGKLRSAFAQYTKGLEQDKSSRALLLNRALCCLKLNNKSVMIEKLGEEVTLDSFQQCIDDCTKALDICEFLYDNDGPGIKQNRVKAHMRRAEAKSRLGKLAEALLDIEEALANIPNLSPQDTQQLNELVAKFKFDKDSNDRVLRLREIAGVSDVSVPEKENAEGAASSKSGAPVGGAAADSEADMEAAASSPSSVSSSSSPKSGTKVEEVEEKETQRGGVGEEGGDVTPVVGAKMRNPANAVLYDKSDASILAVGQRVASWVDALREEEEKGMVAFDNEDGTYDIVLDDGTEKDAVPRSEIRRLQQPLKIVPAEEGKVEEKQIKVEEVVEEVKKFVQEVVEVVDRLKTDKKDTRALTFENFSQKKQVTKEVASEKKEVAKAEANPASPSVAKGAMRKIMVVEDESDEEDAAPPAKTNTPATAPKPAISAQKSAVDAKTSPANDADAMMEAMKVMGLGGTGMSGMGMPGSPPGMGSPEDMQSAAEFAQRMAKMMQDPDIQKSLKNPRVQQVMGEMMAGGATAANALSDDEVLKKYKDDPEVMYFYSKISSALEGVFKTPYPVDTTPILTPAPSAAKPAAAASKGEKNGKTQAGERESSKKEAGFGGLACMDASSMRELKGNPDLQAALKDPKMLKKLHALMTNPGSAEAAISADPDLAALEDKLMAALGVNAPTHSAAAPAGPGAGHSEEKYKTSGKRANVSQKMSPEDRLKSSLVTVQSLKAALQKHGAAVAAAKGVEDLEDQDRTREAAHSKLCSEVQEELQLLQAHVEHDDDVVALLLDQAGVDTVCSLIMALPPTALGGAGNVFSDALLVLKLVGVQERCSMGLLLHGKGRTVVKMLAWMQGVEPCSPTTVADIAIIMEIALQHDTVRRTLLKKSWSYSAKGASGPQRVSLLAAAAAASTRPEAMQSALGCITNAAFEEHGKEQLLAHEQSLMESSSSSESLLEAAVRVADSNPSGAEVGGSGAGVLRAKAMRLLLNVSASAGIRALVGKKSGLRFLVRILEEQMEALSKAKYSTAAAASLLHGQDALDTTLGLLMNLGLDDDRASELLSQGVLAPLAAILKTCPWDSSLARSASACARLLRFPLGAKQAREVGVLQGLLQVVKKAAGSSASTTPVSFPPAAGKSGVAANEAKAEVLEPSVRALAQALKNDEGSIKAVGEDITALLAMVSAVKCGREGTVGNSALALQMVANRSEYLEHLGQAGAVPALLNVVHHMRGPAQRNAALALARVVKREENMACLKALHGIEILNCYLKL